LKKDDFILIKANEKITAMGFDKTGTLAGGNFGVSR